MDANASLTKLSEQQLLRHFGELVRDDQRRTAQLLAAVAEIDERKLWAKHACPSMFAFCIERFHMSESVAAKRIRAARAARRFPLVLAMIARGELHLSAVGLLAAHLTQGNHRRLLERAKHKSTREIELLVAEIAPRPDAPTRIRALPRATRGAVGAAPTPQLVAGAPESRDEQTIRESSSHSRESVAAAQTVPDAPASLTCKRGESSNGLREPATAAHQPETRRKQITALAPRRYRVEITVDQETHDKLRTLEDLLSHETPRADAATIIGRAIEVLLAETLKKKAALTRHAGRPARAAGKRTRAIPATIRRKVWVRDGGRCAYVDEQGRRCRATRLIEYHHAVPYCRGGAHEVDNITLRCRAHNQYQADLDLGVELMQARRREGPGERAYVRSRA